MQIKDIIGQNEVKLRLTSAAHKGRIPHALLFTGQPGVGKLQVALAFAQYLACPRHTETDSCGVCPSCLQYAKLQHPDLHFVYPIVKPEGAKEVVCDDFGKEWRAMISDKKYFDLDDWYERMGVSNKQGMIYDRESGEIIRKLSLKSFGDGYKTMIIWLPEKMNESCANKLLKIIEEPPTKTVFILVSNEPQKLLPTILSRVQQIAFDRLSEEQITEALRSMNDELSVADALDFAHMANGSYLTAVKHMQASEQQQQFFSWFVALMRNAWLVGHKQAYDSLLELRNFSREIADAGRERQKAFLEYAQNQVRENYITNYVQSPEMATMVYQTQEERRFSTNFARFINSSNVDRLTEQLALAQRQIEQNGSPKMIFFDLCLQMIVLIK